MSPCCAVDEKVKGHVSELFHITVELAGQPGFQDGDVCLRRAGYLPPGGAVPYPQFVRPGRLSPHDRRLRLLPMLLTHLSFREIDEEMFLAGPRRGHRDPAQFPQAQGSGMVTCV